MMILISSSYFHPSCKFSNKTFIRNLIKDLKLGPTSKQERVSSMRDKRGINVK